MRYLLFALAFLSVSCFAKDVHIEGTDVSFVVPDDFLTLTQEMIDLKWPSNNAPRWAVGNERGSTTIAYDLKDNDISGWSLDTLGFVLEDAFSKNVSNIQWLRKEIIELSGRSWVYLELTSSAIGTDIYNMMVATSYQNKMLIMNFNSTKEDIVQYKDILDRSIESISYRRGY